MNEVERYSEVTLFSYFGSTTNKIWYFFCQQKYANDLLKRTGMKNCNLAITLRNINEKLQLEDGEAFTNARQYRILV